MKHSPANFPSKLMHLPSNKLNTLKQSASNHHSTVLDESKRMLSDDEILKSIKITLTPEQETFLSNYHSKTMNVYSSDLYSEILKYYSERNAYFPS